MAHTKCLRPKVILQKSAVVSLLNYPHIYCKSNSTEYELNLEYNRSDSDYVTILKSVKQFVVLPKALDEDKEYSIDFVADYIESIELIEANWSYVLPDGSLMPLFLIVKCNHCELCTDNKTKDWEFRCRLETEHYPCMPYFITLTYDDNNYPGSVVKRDFQNFMKKLRQYIHLAIHTPEENGKFEAYLTSLPNRERWIGKHYQVDDVRLRFFACGHYGTENKRGHYHICLWNYPTFNHEWMTKKMLTEMIQYCWKKGDRGRLYTYNFGSMKGKQGKNLDIQLVESGTSKNTIRYIARYIGDHNVPQANCEEPFILKSIGLGTLGDQLQELVTKVYANPKQTEFNIFSRHTRTMDKYSLTPWFYRYCYKPDSSFAHYVHKDTDEQKVTTPIYDAKELLIQFYKLNNLIHDTKKKIFNDVRYLPGLLVLHDFCVQHIEKYEDFLLACKQSLPVNEVHEYRHKLSLSELRTLVGLLDSSTFSNSTCLEPESKSYKRMHDVESLLFLTNTLQHDFIVHAVPILPKKKYRNYATTEQFSTFLDVSSVRRLDWFIDNPISDLFISNAQRKHEKALASLGTDVNEFDFVDFFIDFKNKKAQYEATHRHKFGN